MKSTMEYKLVLIICVVCAMAAIDRTNFNLAEPKRNSISTAGNENLILRKRETKSRLRLFEMNQRYANERKIAIEKVAVADSSSSKRIKQEQIGFETDAFIVAEPTAIVDNISSMNDPTVQSISITEEAASISPSTIKNTLEKFNQSFPGEIRTTERAIKMEDSRRLNVAATKDRKPVKLNMKQAVVMNQILNTYGLNDVNNSNCREHVQEFKTSLRALEPWALKMFDASSKLMSGILDGNLDELGSWHECLNIKTDTPSGQIRGQHCTLHIHPTDQLIKIILNYKRNFSEKYFQNLKLNIMDQVKLRWSVCVPESCSYKDVLQHFTKQFNDITEGLNLTLSLTEDRCASIKDLPKFTRGDVIYVVCVSTVLALVLICTIIEFLSQDTINKWIGLFALKQNSEILFSTRSSANDITCLHGIRFLTMYLIVYGHRYVNNMASPLLNYMSLVDWLESYYSTTVHGGTMTVDTFLLIGSTLVSYTFLNLTEKGVKMNLILFYLNRHLRLLVPLLLAVSTYNTVTKFFGSGPLYNEFLIGNYNTCGKYWWTPLLYLQPFVNSKAICIVQTWFLSVDMWWYYYSPLFLVTVTRSKITGYFILLIGYALSTATNFYVAWREGFNGQMPVSPVLLSSDYFSMHYTQPLVRGGPYLIGLGFGHFLYNQKNRKIQMSGLFKATGWIVVSLGLPFLVLYSHSFRVENFEYNRLFASLFLCLHRTLWCFGIMWIIACCQHGYGGVVNRILSWNGFKILGRLCYNIFLFHFLFQSVTTNSKKVPTYFSDFQMTYEAISDMFLITTLSVPLTLCFEYPFSRMCGLLFRRGLKEKTNKVTSKLSEKPFTN